MDECEQDFNRLLCEGVSELEFSAIYEPDLRDDEDHYIDISAYKFDNEDEEEE